MWSSNDGKFEYYIIDFLRTLKKPGFHSLQKGWIRWPFWCRVHCHSCSLSPGKKSEEENLFEIITASEVHYFLQAATPKERTEWIKAIQVASRTGKWGCTYSSSSPSCRNPTDKFSPGSVHFWWHISKRGPRDGNFSSAGVLNVTNHMSRDVHLRPTTWLTEVSPKQI